MLTQEAPATDTVNSCALVREAADNAAFPWRAALTGLALVPVCVYWIDYTEIVVNAADLAAMSLIMAVVAMLLVIIAANGIVRAVAPRLAFSQSELLLIYVINSTTVGITGLGMMQYLATELTAPVYYANAANRWDSWRYLLRSWAFPDPGVVHAFYGGHSSLFADGHFAGWLSPMIVWSVFIFVMLFTMYCISSLLRRRWVEAERLQFPIIVIPLELTRDGGAGPIFRNPVFWLGAGIAVVIEVLATLHYTAFPTMPYVPVKPHEMLYDLGANFKSPPWNGIGTLQVAIYPMVIGLAYLLSLDVLFSIWFFYLVSKVENVVCVSYGLAPGGASTGVSAPFLAQQAAGSYTALAVMVLCYAFPHLKAAFRFAFQRAAKSEIDSDAREPMSYRAAYLGLVGGMVFLIGFGVMLGLSVWLAIGFFVLFMLWAVAVSRIRAEAGPPWLTGPEKMVHGSIVDTIGPQNFSPQELSGVITMRWFDTDFRTLAMPQQLDAMKLAGGEGSGAGRIDARHMTTCILVAIVLATCSSWIALLSIYYQHGAGSANIYGWRTLVGQLTFEQLQTWLRTSTPLDHQSLGWALGAMGMTALLGVMRTRYAWWPFHPIGYALSLTSVEWIWFPIFVGWLVKSLIVRYGGLKIYRQALPFFIGLVVGDYAISALLAVVYSVLGVTGYRTFPI